MNSDWQTRFPKSTEGFWFLYEEGLYTDCGFQVGTGPEKKYFKAHKLVLSVASAVFEKMLFGEIGDDKLNIVVTDIEATVFEQFLRLIYTEEVNFSNFNEAVSIFCVANKYMVQRIIDPCLAYILENMNFSNAALAYEVLCLFGADKALEDCKKILLTETSDVLRSETFKEVQKDTLLFIFSEDTLAIDSEIELYDAAVKWVEAEICREGISDENKKKTLFNEIFQHIRFLSMSTQEFIKGPALNPFMPKEDGYSILMKIGSPDISIPLPEMLSKKKRSILKVPLPEDWKKRLQTAGEEGEIDVIKKLQRSGADLKVKLDNTGYTVLHPAAGSGHYKTCEWLMDQGLSPNQADNDGLTPLHWAVYYNRSAVTELLLDRGADPRLRCNWGTVLEVAVSRGYDHIADIIVNKFGQL